MNTIITDVEDWRDNQLHDYLSQLDDVEELEYEEEKEDIHSVRVQEFYSGFYECKALTETLIIQMEKSGKISPESALKILQYMNFECEKLPKQ